MVHDYLHYTGRETFMDLPVCYKQMRHQITLIHNTVWGYYNCTTQHSG